MCEPTWTITPSTPSSEPSRSSAVERVDTLGEQLVVGAGEVDQVDRVDEGGAEPGGPGVGAEAADVVAVVLASPLLGGGAEDLDRFGADLFGAFDGLVDAAGGGDVRTDGGVCARVA